MLARSFSLTAVLVTLTIVGCETKTAMNPAMLAEHRQRLLLDEEPTGALAPAELREQEGGFSEGPVVLVGQIGGLPNPLDRSAPDFPWQKGEATFFLVDPATAAEFADHAQDDPDHAENCPFCARAAEGHTDAIAVVTFHQEKGKPIAIGADQLFSLDENDVVVVRGQGKVQGKLLTVVADGIYVRK